MTRFHVLSSNEDCAKALKALLPFLYSQPFWQKLADIYAGLFVMRAMLTVNCNTLTISWPLFFLAFLLRNVGYKGLYLNLEQLFFFLFLKSYFGVVIIEGLWKRCQGHRLKKTKGTWSFKKNLGHCFLRVRSLENGITLRTVVGIRLDDAAMLSLAAFSRRPRSLNGRKFPNNMMIIIILQRNDGVCCPRLTTQPLWLALYPFVMCIFNQASCLVTWRLL